MRRLASLAAAVLLATATVLVAQKPDPAIAKLADQYQAAFNKGDVKALTAMYTADALRIVPTGQLVTGRAAIEKEYATAFAGPLKGTKLALQAGRTQMIKPDVALFEGTFAVTGGSTPMRGRFLNTLVMDGGQWKLASVVTVPEMPAPAK